MDKKAEITGIVLNLGDKEVALSLDQARRLHCALDEMFSITPLIPSYPIIIYRDRPHWDYPYLTWGDSSGGPQMSWTPENQSLNLNVIP